MKKLFFNAHGKIRCGWRLALFLVCWLLLSGILSLPASLWGWEGLRFEGSKPILRPDPWAMLLSALLVSFMLMRYLDKRPLGSLGLKFHARWWKELLMGIGIGALLPFLLLAIKIQSLKVAWALDLQSFLVLAMRGFRIAVTEELLFRGLPLQILIEGLGVTNAVLVTSILFGFVHVQAQGWLALVTIGGSSILLAIAYLKTKALWMPIGIHFAWNYFNWILDRIFHASSAPLLLSGFIVLFYTITTSAFLFLKLKPHPEMETLWQQYVPIAQPWAQLKAWWTRRKQAARDQTPPAS